MKQKPIQDCKRCKEKNGCKWKKDKILSENCKYFEQQIEDTK